MTSKSVTTKQNNCQAPETPCMGVTGQNANSMTTGALCRAERTPGAVAVSQERQTRQGLNTSAFSVQTNSLSPLRQTCSDTSWAVVAECQNEPGKFFAKRIYCGKEWCPVCGNKRSRAHNRRIARVLPKAKQIESMGYFVIEFPDKYRKVVGYGYSKKALRIASNKIVEVLAGKRMGRRGRVGGFFSRGLLRWHWFGDKMNGKWNPHANVLVDGVFIKDLEPIKAALRSALRCPDLIVHYRFKPLPAEKFQCVEYITRPTFLKYEWSPYMAAQLYGFRNQRWWGKWDGEAVWSVDATQEAELLEADALEQGICPDCSGELVWTKPLNAAWLHTWGAVEIGETGYYRIPTKVFDGDTLSPGDIKRLDKLRVAAENEPLSRRIYGSRAWVRGILFKIEDDIPWQDILGDEGLFSLEEDSDRGVSRT